MLDTVLPIHAACAQVDREPQNDEHRHAAEEGRQPSVRSPFILVKALFDVIPPCNSECYTHKKPRFRCVTNSLQA